MRKKILLICSLIVLVFILIYTYQNRPKFKDCADGVYIAEARGYRKHLHTEVEFKDGYIIRVDVIEHYEGGYFHYHEPIEKIPVAIVEEQSLTVDVVSGSTLTSNGIMQAVTNASKLARAEYDKQNS